MTAPDPAIAAQPSPSLQAVERLLGEGDPAGARRELDRVAASVGDQDGLAHDVAQFYMHLKEPALAARWYARAVAQAPGSMPCLYNYSTALAALGQLEDAEAALDQVTQRTPDDYSAWYNRAKLRRQTPQDNHVAALREQLRKPGVPRQGQAPLYYALAKELEDLGRFEESFDALTRGAAARRACLSYRVEDDVDIMRAIRQTHDADVVRAEPTGYADVRPIFVVGLPRSGTTLVERILSSHSAIASHGEGPSFSLALMKTAGRTRGKQELLDRSTRLDPRSLGQAYARWASMPPGEPVVDKTPSNYLYLGLIPRALPNARVVYVRRRPMDVCYAMYQTLFRTAFPFTYSLSDLGDYWLAFNRLMRHWQDSVPPRCLLTLDYEDLVTAPETGIRRLLEHVGVPWQDACLDFSRNPLPTLTASNAQVRQPMYTSSVGKWQRHADGLAPLVQQLQTAGVPIATETPND